MRIGIVAAAMLVGLFAQASDFGGGSSFGNVSLSGGSGFGGGSLGGGSGFGGRRFGGGSSSGSPTPSSVAAPVRTDGVRAVPEVLTYWSGLPDHDYQWEIDAVHPNGPFKPKLTFTGDRFTVTSARDAQGKVELSRFTLVAPDGESHQIYCDNSWYGIPPPSTVLTELPCESPVLDRAPNSVNGNSVSLFDLLIDNDSAGVHKRYPGVLKAQALDAKYAKGVCPDMKDSFFLRGRAVADPVTREGECYLSAEEHSTLAVLGFGMKEVVRVTVNGQPCTGIQSAKVQPSFNSDSLLVCDAPPIPSGEETDIVVTSAGGESSTVKYGKSALYSPHSKVHPNVLITKWLDKLRAPGEPPTRIRTVAFDPAKRLTQDGFLHDAAVGCPGFAVNWYGWSAQSDCQMTDTPYGDHTAYVNTIDSPQLKEGVRIYYIKHVAEKAGTRGFFELTAGIYPDMPGKLRRLQSVLGKPLPEGGWETPPLQFDAYGPADAPRDFRPAPGPHDYVLFVDALAVNPDGSYGIVPDVFRFHFKMDCTDASCAWQY